MSEAGLKPPKLKGRKVLSYHPSILTWSLWKIDIILTARRRTAKRTFGIIGVAGVALSR